MDIKKRLKELETMHAKQAAAYQSALEAADAAKVNLIKIEGGMEILREILAGEGSTGNE